MATCVFCKENLNRSDGREIYYCDCNICGMYYITPKLHEKLLNINNVNTQLVNCIYENIKEKKDNEYHLLWSEGQITDNNLKQYSVRIFNVISTQHVFHSKKIEEILKYSVQTLQHQNPFDNVSIDKETMFKCKINNSAELCTWLRKMKTDSLIETNDANVNGNHQLQKENCQIPIEFKLTTNGLEQVEKNINLKTSNNVFIAMQFDWEKEDNILTNDNNKKFVEAIKSACFDLGFEAKIIKEKEHNNYITDEIIAEIKSSKFMIADFTFQNHGAYYEAGFAKGLNIPVINTINQNHSKDIHFDIKQINYIEWGENDLEKFKVKLKNRIKAVII